MQDGTIVTSATTIDDTAFVDGIASDTVHEMDIPYTAILWLCQKDIIAM